MKTENLERIVSILGFVGVTLLSFNYLIAMSFLIIYDFIMAVIMKRKGLKKLMILMIYYMLIGFVGVYRSL